MLIVNNYFFINYDGVNFWLIIFVISGYCDGYFLGLNIDDVIYFLGFMD